MNAAEAASSYLSTFHKDHTSLRQTFDNPEPAFSKSLAKYGIMPPFSLIDTAFLLLSISYTEKDLKFFRAYIGGMPPLHVVRTVKYTFIESLRRLSILNIEHDEWLSLENGLVNVSGDQFCA